MTEDQRPLHTGGCQCGAVRYALFDEPFNPHLCHCRMCQKAFGSLFAPLVSVQLDRFAWTRGAPAIFASSPSVRRGFCANCGTPLSFHSDGTDRISVAIGSLDDPAKVPPDNQIGIEARVPWFADLHTLPERSTEQAVPANRLAQIENLQHPDHDTETWPVDG